MGTEKKYRSAISYGLIIPMSIVLVAAAVTTVYSGQVIAIIIVGAVIFGVVLPIFLDTNYTIADGKLKVRSGWLVNIEIAIDAIKEVRSTGSILSSPALSLTDRIDVTYGKYDNVVISPAEREAFIADLLAINPAIVVEERGIR